MKKRWMLLMAALLLSAFLPACAVKEGRKLCSADFKRTPRRAGGREDWQSDTAVGFGCRLERTILCADVIGSAEF